VRSRTLQLALAVREVLYLLAKRPSSRSVCPAASSFLRTPSSCSGWRSGLSGRASLPDRTTGPKARYVAPMTMVPEARIRRRCELPIW
jgi:hypothetical protein